MFAWLLWFLADEHPGIASTFSSESLFRCSSKPPELHNVRSALCPAVCVQVLPDCQLMISRWQAWSERKFRKNVWERMSERMVKNMTYLVTSCKLLLWDILSATTTNPFDRGWGPARHTELTGSRLGSGTPRWTRRIAVEVRHATLNSRARGWGPARHTELTSSWLGSGTPHWTHRIAVGVRHATLNSRVRHATLNSRARGWGPARHTELTRSWLRSGTSHGRNR